LSVRTRVAPSPTGDPHVGTAYVALFNYCFAKKHGGQFLLRIEDTDRARSTSASERAILRALRWLGIEWDEGPEVGGPNGPYRQSERGDIYRQHADMLLASGHAFRCFCTAEELSASRDAARQDGVLGYDGRCLHIPQDEAERRAAAGEPYVVRLAVPREGTVTVQDVARGPITFEWREVDMQVLLKQDGMPTYHLANVVDDHLMGITHVIRGEEWISSAPKHVLLYRAFGWELPVICHLPLLRNPDRSKLSKRRNPTSILYYRDMGYLPEALLNYLGTLAWSRPSGDEKFTVADMVNEFTLERISLGGPIFDVEKLDSLCGRWIREELTPEALADRVQAWRLNREYLVPVAQLAQPRIHRLSDLEPLTGFFLAGLVPVDASSFQGLKLPAADIALAIDTMLGVVDRLEWEKGAIERALRSLSTAMGVKLKDLLPPFYVAITGKPSSVPLFDALALLGKDITRVRLRHAAGVLGGLTEDAGARRDALLETVLREP
jgi:glutamyl-tRNA synthetase